jgi:undecaprenyl-diphosphatase
VDPILLIKAAIMGIVEGLTEFLPISSTGHLILAGALLGFNDEKSKVFDIAIQTGAIAAVVLVYAQRLKAVAIGLPSDRNAQRFVLHVLIAFFPAVILGLLFGDVIKLYLFNAWVVASTFILGGLVILWAERRHERLAALSGSGAEQRSGLVQAVDDITPALALKIGLVQCLAMIPGTSRSGATIIGGMFLGMSRQCATDFSFFLAIPTLVGAGAYSLYKSRHLLTLADAPMFAVGLLFSFLSAWLCVRWLLKFVATHNFVPFAWYRIGFGILVLVTAWTGAIQWAE